MVELQGFAVLCQLAPPQSVSWNFLGHWLAILPSDLFSTQPYGYAVAIGLYFCFHRSMYRGLLPHQFTPMPGIHKRRLRTLLRRDRST